MSAECKIATVFLVLAGLVSRALAADSRQLTLAEAVQLAIHQNRALRIARLNVDESEEKKAIARSGYFPHISNQSSFLHTTSVQNIEIPAGAFGVFSSVG